MVLSRFRRLAPDVTNPVCCGTIDRDLWFLVGRSIRAKPEVQGSEAIAIQGDGRAVRSYLYAADLVVWLLTLLIRGAAGQAYNVGSDQAVTIRDLAALLAATRTPTLPIEVATAAQPGPPNRYVPAITRARAELALDVRIDLATAIARTLAWLTQPSDLI